MMYCPPPPRPRYPPTFHPTYTQYYWDELFVWDQPSFPSPPPSFCFDFFFTSCPLSEWLLTLFSTQNKCWIVPKLLSSLPSLSFAHTHDLWSWLFYFIFLQKATTEDVHDWQPSPPPANTSHPHITHIEIPSPVHIPPISYTHAFFTLILTNKSLQFNKTTTPIHHNHLLHAYSHISQFFVCSRGNIIISYYV